jgi:hypothetical protein
MGKPEGNRPLGIPRYKRQKNIRNNLMQDGMAWTGLIWFWIGTSGGIL